MAKVTILFCHYIFLQSNFNLFSFHIHCRYHAMDAGVGEREIIGSPGGPYTTSHNLATSSRPSRQ